MSGKVIDLERKRAQARERAQRFRDRNTRIDTPSGFRSTCSVCGEVFFARRKNVRVCGEGGCAKQKPRGRAKPFTVAHFKRWASGVVLDTEEPWKVEPFQELFLADVFGERHKLWPAELDLPTPQEIWLLIPEGNAKTTLLAGLGLYECQFKRGGRVPVAASSRDQAFEMYLQAQGMVERSVSLDGIFTCHEGLRQIKCESMASRIQVYASDDKTGDGAIFTKALIDELHRHKDLRLYRTWAGKLDKRPGAQVIGISTAGEPGSDFEDTRANIRQRATFRVQRDALLLARSERVVLHEFAVPENGDVEDLKLVKLANPLSTITATTLRRKREAPTMTLAHWKRFTCNVATRGGSSAVSEAEWFRQKTEIEIPPGFPVWAGLDVAWKWDTTALVPLWIPGEAEFAREDFPLHTRRQLLDLFGGSLPVLGDFRLLGRAAVLEPPRDGNSLDPELVEDALLELHDRNPIHTLVMDTTRAETLASWAAQHLGCEVIDRAQSNKFAAMDYERWMDGLRTRVLWHQGCPNLSQHVLNAVTRVLEGGQARFERPKESRQVSDVSQQRRRVIDALSAASMAHTSAVAEFMEEGGVVYG